jgi:tellurite resistance protein TehA-like permease
MIVTSATGAVISAHLDQRAGVAVLVVSFMSLSLGLAMCSIILAIYFWRLMKCKLPAREAIISCFVPVGPPGMGAYAVQNLAIGLATHIGKYKFTLEHAPQPPVSAQTIGAIAEGVHWLGVISSFSLLAIGTFFLVEAFASLWAKSPRSFNIGFWAFVFPCGVYANGVCMLGSDIRNEGLRGFGAACAVGTVLFCLGCALATFYKGVWRGKLFYAPGLQGWLEQEQLDKRRKTLSEEDTNAVPLHNMHSLRNGHALGSCGADEYGGNLVHISSSTDGTYAFSRRISGSDQHEV